MGSEPAPQTASAAAEEPLRHNRDFATLLVSQSVSSGGDAVSSTAMPLLVLALTGSGLAMGIVAAVSTGADFLMGTVAGAFADRGDRRRMMLVADIGRAGLTALIPLSDLLHGPMMAVILLVAGPLAILRGFFRAGYLAAMPNLVGRSQLARGNGILESAYSASFIVGPAIAAFLVTAIGPGPTLAIDAASFAVSAVGLFLIRRELKAPADRAPSRICRRHPRRHRLRGPPPDPPDGHPAVRDHVHGSGLDRRGDDLPARPRPGAGAGRVRADALRAGRRDAGRGAAGIAARAANERRADPRGVGARDGVPLLLSAAVPSVPAIVGLTALSGLGEAMLIVVYVSVRAANSPDALVGRIASTARTISLGLQPIGAVIGGILIDSVGGTATLAIMGAFICAVGLAFGATGSLREASLRPAAGPGSPDPLIPASEGIGT